MPESVVLLGGDAETGKLARRGLEVSGGGMLEELDELESVLQRLRRPGTVAAVCIGAHAADPLKAVQHMHSIDRDVAVVLLAESERCVELTRALQFTPFIGPDVACRSLEDLPLLGSELSEAASRTRQRRGHRRTISSVVKQISALPPPDRPPPRWLGRLLDHAPVGVVVTDASHCVRSSNRQAAELLDGESAALLGRPLLELFPADAADRLRGLLDRRQPSETPRAPELLSRPTAAGEQWLELRVTGLPEAESDLGALIILQDVTARVVAERARRAAERELRRSHALLNAIVEGTTDAVYVKDAQSRYVLMNAAGARVAQRSVDQVMGRTPAELFPPDTARMILEDDARVKDNRRTITFEEVVRTPDGPRTFLSTKSPLIDEQGEVVGVIGISRDIEDRKREEERHRFLAHATELLSSSLDYGETLANVARAAVPSIADWCAVDMLGPGTRIKRLAIVHAEPERERFGWELFARYPPRYDAEAGLGYTLRTGRPQLYPDVAPELLESVAVDAEHLRLLQGMGLTSGMVVPLTSASQVLGSLTFATAESGRRLGPRDLELAQELARRAATAIEHARLHAERLHIATTLQASLLPSVIPEIPGVEVSARFRAAGAGNEVGGDFYDVFKLDGESWLVVIGDVCGKGAEAAAVTALARYTIRAVAMHDKSPARILWTLNKALLRQRAEGDYCTVAVARLERRGRELRVTLASGGHPRPLVVRADATVEPVGSVGTLLGVLEDPDLPETEVDLAPGDGLVFFTDGIPEAGAPARVLRPDDLVAALAPLARRGAVRMAERLETLALEAGGPEPRDDLALVAVALPTAVPVPPEIEDELLHELEPGPALAAEVRQALAPLEPALGGQLFHNLRLAATELAVNALRHADIPVGGRIGLRVRTTADSVRLEVADPGPGFARPDTVPEPEGPGGWGLFIVDQLAERWGVEREEGTRVWAELRARPATPAQPEEALWIST